MNNVFFKNTNKSKIIIFFLLGLIFSNNKNNLNIAAKTNKNVQKKIDDEIKKKWALKNIIIKINDFDKTQAKTKKEVESIDLLNKIIQGKTMILKLEKMKEVNKIMIEERNKAAGKPIGEQDENILIFRSSNSHEIFQREELKDLCDAGIINSLVVRVHNVEGPCKDRNKFGLNLKKMKSKKDISNHDFIIHLDDFIEYYKEFIKLNYYDPKEKEIMDLVLKSDYSELFFPKTLNNFLILVNFFMEEKPGETWNDLINYQYASDEDKKIWDIYKVKSLTQYYDTYNNVTNNKNTIESENASIDNGTITRSNSFFTKNKKLKIVICEGGILVIFGTIILFISKNKTKRKRNKKVNSSKKKNSKNKTKRKKHKKANSSKKKISKKIITK